MRIFLLITTLFLSPMLWGQTLLKGTFFSAHALGVCRDTTQTLKVGFDEGTGNLMVYTWTGVRGEIDIKFEKGAEEKKGAKAKIGGFMKNMEAINKANNDQPAAYDAACLALRRYPLASFGKAAAYEPTPKGALAFYKDSETERVPYAQMRHTLVYPRLMREKGTYKFLRDKRYESCGEGKPFFDTLPLLDPAKLAAAYPDLGLGTERSEVYLAMKGEGLLGTKNLRPMVLRSAYALGVDSTDTRVKYLASEAAPLKAEANAAQFKGFVATGDVPLALEDGTRLSLLRGDGSDDKWDRYMKYRLVRYDDQGTLLSQADIASEFIKEIGFFGFTYDPSGRPKGVAVVLSDIATIGGKSKKDPKDNRHLLYCFDLQGKERFHCAFEHPGVRPTLVVERGGKFDFLGDNNEKTFKIKSEVLTVDEHGAVSAVEHVREPGQLDVFRLLGTRASYLGEGTLLLTGSTPKADNSLGRAVAAIVTTDFKILASCFIEHEDLTPALVDYLGVFGGRHHFAFSTQRHNHFIGCGGEAGKKTLVFPTPESKGLYKSPALVDKNYVLDKKAGKLYAFYQHKTGNGLGYVVAVNMEE